MEEVDSHSCLDGEDHSIPSELPSRSSGDGAWSIQPPGHIMESSSDVSRVGGHSGAKYKLMSPAMLPISRSPCITIPPGLSPSSFLESPVLLSNVKVEPSPTTGSFFNAKLIPFSGCTAEFSAATNFLYSKSIDEKKSSGYEFKFQVGSGVSSTGPVMVSGFNGQECKIIDQIQNQYEPHSLGLSYLIKSENAAVMKDVRASVSANMVVPGSMPIDVDGNGNGLSNRGLAVNGAQASESEQKDIGSTVIPERSSDDGYNWRKYGQKLVKGSEFPRSYYKCTYPNCEVKKIFERSHEGHITEIVYKGTHDHPKPQPSRRFTAGALMSIQQEKIDKVSSVTGNEDKPTFNTQNYNTDPNGTPAISPRQANDDSIDGGTSYLNNVTDDVDEDDPDSKRRKLEGGCIDITPVVKPIREPRVVVQTVSEVDILDDGYRWRKYGQKVVRGNPNPRSYYKCTNTGCPVRKHVERASHDPKAVITTYEGKHNHDVPTARNSAHETAAPPMVNEVSSRFGSEDNGSISLNLGVGVGYGSENRTRGPIDAKFFQSQNAVTSSNIKVGPPSSVSHCYGVVTGSMNLYGSRENHVDTPPLHHSSDQYSQNLGRVLLGP